MLKHFMYSYILLFHPKYKLFVEWLKQKNLSSGKNIYLRILSFSDLTCTLTVRILVILLHYGW